MLVHLDADAQVFEAPTDAHPSTAWWRSAVFYEVYIRSFQDSNGDGIGDLRGIEQRLPYLQQLGVDALWITPFYPSPMADFGYDVADYTAVDPSFGTMADFDRLLRAAHDRDIRIVIDMVLNHTSDAHPWFAESRSSRTNPKRDWYIWRDAQPDGSPPNNWTTFFGGSAWAWDETTQQYYLHLFLDRQPDLNWRNPEVIAAVDDVLRFWLDKGIDGFRLDAINFLIKHADFPDMPVVTNATGGDLVQYHVHVNNQPELHPLLQNVRRVLESYPGERVLIGETGTLKAPELAEFYGADLDEIHLPMIVLPLHTPWQAAAMRQCLLEFYAGLPPGATPHFVFSNHDDKRLITRYGYEQHRSIAVLLLTLLGSPILYYGDEIAMCDMFIPLEKRVDTAGLIDPDTYPGRDPNRTPMQWDASQHAGFTPDTVEPWLPVNENRSTINVAVQAAAPDSTLTFYTTLLHLRRDSRALRVGSIQFLEETGDVLAYVRTFGDERLLIAINFGSGSPILDLSELADQAHCVLSSTLQRPDAVALAAVALNAYESVVFKLGAGGT